jgi:hypothetical protein
VGLFYPQSARGTSDRLATHRRWSMAAIADGATGASEQSVWLCSPNSGAAGTNGNARISSGNHAVAAMQTATKRLPGAAGAICEARS